MELDKITKIQFNPDQDYIWGIKGLEQWDQGQKLEISGLDISDEIVEVHFSLQEFQGVAKRMVGTVKDGVIHTDIPVFVLEGPEYIYGNSDVYSAYAWIYVSDEQSAETIRKIEFEIKARPKPEDYVTPEELSFLQQLEQAMKNKLDKSGYAPGKYLGTDTEGNVVEKDAPGGGDVSDEQVAQAVEEYLSENPIKVEVPTKTSQLTNDSGFITEIPKDLGKTHVVKYGDSIGNITSRIESGEDYSCKFSFINQESGLYDNNNGSMMWSMETMIKEGMIDVYLDDGCFYKFNDEILSERVWHNNGCTFVTDRDWSEIDDMRSDYVTAFVLPNIHNCCSSTIKAYSSQSIYSLSAPKQVEEWKEYTSTNASVKNVESFNVFEIATTILMPFVRTEVDEYRHYVYFTRCYEGVEYIVGYDWEEDYWYYEIREYATKDYVDQKATDVDLTNYATKEYVDSNFVESPTTAEVGQMLVVKAVDENGVPTEWEVSDVASTDKFRIETSDQVATLEPNKLYVFPEMVSLEIVLGGTLDTSITQEYTFRFTSGETATTLTLPSTVVGDITIEANTVYEVSIIDNYLMYQSWVVA